MRITALIGAFAVAMPALGWPGPSSIAKEILALSKGQCEAAVFAVSELLVPGRPVVLSRRAPEFQLQQYSVDNLLKNWNGEPPGQDHIVAFLKAPRHSALECTSVMKRAKGRVAGKDAAAGLPAPGSVKFTELVSAPILSKDGNSAIVLVKSEAGFGGEQRLIHLHRSATGWKVVGVKPLSVF